MLAWPAGLNGLVFKTTDSDAAHAALTEAGVPALPAQSFSRPVETASGTREAAFRTVRLPREATPSGRMFFCHHLTPELVWPDGRASHPNGAVGIAGMLIAAEDPARLADLFAQMFGRHSVRGARAGSTCWPGWPPSRW